MTKENNQNKLKQIIDNLLLINLFTVIFFSTWEKILKFINNITINTNLVLYISINIFNYYNNWVKFTLYLLLKYQL